MTDKTTDGAENMSDGDLAKHAWFDRLFAWLDGNQHFEHVMTPDEKMSHYEKATGDVCPR